MTDYQPRHRADVLVDSCEYDRSNVCDLHDTGGMHRAYVLAVVPSQREGER
jgi:hypothetical protein